MIKKIFRFTLILAFALIAHNHIWGNLNFQDPMISLIKVAFILAIFEFILKPVVKILLLPINLITLGAFRIVINTLGLYLAVFLLADFRLNPINTPPSVWQGISIPAFNFTGFTAYLVSSLTIGLLLYFFNMVLTKKS